jgi:transposase-like protein
MKQSTATINTVLAVLSDRNYEYELNGSVNMSDVFTKEDKAKVCEILMAGFKADKIDMSEEAKVKYSEEAELKKYTNSLISNWVRKHKEFNGGAKYTPSFTRDTDPQIKEMRKLLNSGALDEKGVSAVEAAIESRKAEIKPEKVTEIDVDLLPEHLRHLLG